MTLREWQPTKVLISQFELNQAIVLAEKNNIPFAPSPVNAALIVFLAIQKVLNENTV